MAKTYHVGLGQRLINGLFRLLARRGLGKRYLHVLTVTGRTSGEPRSVPVDVMEVDGERYLVAPYGEVNWVRNLRVAKRATLQRAGRSHTYDAVELRFDAGVSVIRQYVSSVPVTRDYWDVDEHSTDEEVRQEAHRNPVFHLRRHVT